MVALGRAVRPFCTRSREIRPAPSLHRASTDALIMVSTLEKVCCTIFVVCVISTTVKGTHMQSIESNILKIPFSVTAGQSAECEQSNDDSCPQLEVLRGRDGRDGERGIPGERGAKGDQGWRGEKGEMGSVRLPGVRGPLGLTGETGAKGKQGEKGDLGPLGFPGPEGPAGEKGEKEEQGDQGLPGTAAPVVNCGQTYVRWGRTTCPGNHPQSWPTQEELEGAGTERLVEQLTTSACLTILTTSSMTLVFKGTAMSMEWNIALHLVNH